MKLNLSISVAILLFLLSQYILAGVSDRKKNDTPSGVLHIIVPKAHKSAPAHDSYFPKLIELALEKTKLSDGEYLIETASDNTTNFRKVSEMSNSSGAITIMWSSISPELESSLLPIRVSILKGLNSYRVFLIRKEDQEKFHNIHDLTDLQKFVAGQGAQWADTSVLKRNGIPVASVVNPEMLFDMLVAKRFDFFPRGLYEVWEEQKVHAAKGLIIEDSLLLHYASPVYFFVNKKDTNAANRIERGLKIAIADGSFDELFLSIYGAKLGLEDLKNSKRVKIELRALVNEPD